jgi:hypothetical protein
LYNLSTFLSLPTGSKPKSWPEKCELADVGMMKLPRFPENERSRQGMLKIIKGLLADPMYRLMLGNLWMDSFSWIITQIITSQPFAGLWQPTWCNYPDYHG